MRVKVLYFGLVHDLTGVAEQHVELSEGESVDALWSECAKRFPRLGEAAGSLLCAVNQEIAQRSQTLREGDEVAFLPPVSGGASEDFFGLTREPIPTAELTRQLKAPEDGAVVVFEGIVRDHSLGRRTLYLEYEAYEPMAIRKMEEIGSEARRQYDIDRVGILHRLGRLEIGETSVAIFVTAAHRRAAFEACHYAIDRLKQTVPIWKKEYFEDGAVWAEGEQGAFEDHGRWMVEPGPREETGTGEGKPASKPDSAGAGRRSFRNGHCSDFLTPAIEIAREAGVLLAELFQQPHEITYKRRSDLLTEADRRSEALIVERLRARFPDHAVVAEEGSNHEADSGFCWYVDPLDGTTNFAHGFPMFCVTLGLAFRSEVVAGVVYDPIREELFTVEKGAGAFLNQRRLSVSKVEKLSESLVATGFPPFATNHELNIEFYFRFTELSHGIRRAGSAALDLCSVAAGRFDGFWELKLNPWDKAAGSLLVTEAGGQVTDIAGKSFKLLGDDVFASNGHIHEQMVEVFSEVLTRRVR